MSDRHDGQQLHQQQHRQGVVRASAAGSNRNELDDRRNRYLAAASCSETTGNVAPSPRTTTVVQRRAMTPTNAPITIESSRHFSLSQTTGNDVSSPRTPKRSHHYHDGGCNDDDGEAPNSPSSSSTSARRLDSDYTRHMSATGGSGSSGSGGETLKTRLPSRWQVQENDPDFRVRQNGLRLVGRRRREHHGREVSSASFSSETSILVVTNKPLPMELLHAIARQKKLEQQHPYDFRTRRQVQQEVNVYYFEVTIKYGATWVGLVPSSSLTGSVTYGRFPGDVVGAIGMSSDGQLAVSGQRRQHQMSVVDERVAVPSIALSLPSSTPSSSSEKITIGCGLEVAENRSTDASVNVFFTRNGELFVPPMEVPELDTGRELYFPAVGLQAAGGDVCANFDGLKNSFRWPGSDRHILFSPFEIVPGTKNAMDVTNGRTEGQNQRQVEPLPSSHQRQSAGQQLISVQRMEGTLSTSDEIPLPSDHSPHQRSYDSSPGGNRHNPRQPDPGLNEKLPSKPVPPDSMSRNRTHPLFDGSNSHFAHASMPSSRATFEEMKDAQAQGHSTVSHSPIYGTRSDRRVRLDEDYPESVMHDFHGSHYAMNVSSVSASAAAAASGHIGSRDDVDGPPTEKNHRSDSRMSDAPAAPDLFDAYAPGPAPGPVGAHYVNTPAPGRVGAHYVNTPAPGRVGAHYVNTPAPGRVGAHYVDTPAPGRAGSAAQRASMALMDPQEVSEASEDARNLERCCRDNVDDIPLVESLLTMCRSKRTTVIKTLEDSMLKLDDPAMERSLDELLTLNSVLGDAIELAETHLDGERKPAPVKIQQRTVPLGDAIELAETPLNGERKPAPVKIQPRTVPSVPSVVVGSLEIATLVHRKDVFSLICMLRAQEDVRLDAALALLRFARGAKMTSESEAESIRNEMISSGGMHSLLAIFQSKGATQELKVVVALAISYLLPSFVQSDVLPSSSIGLKIIECLRFLFMSPSVPRGEEFCEAEFRHASVTGVYTFWFFVLLPSISMDEVHPVSMNESRESATRRPSLRMRNSRAFHRQGGEMVFDQRRELLESQELLELTVSLSVDMARTIDGGNNDTPLQPIRLNGNSTPLVEKMSAIVQQMCAIDTARPIAVREGILKVLVAWMHSHNGEKIRCAALSVNELTSTRDSYMAGWIHSQIVNEGALVEIVNLSVSQSVGQDVRLAVAEILCSLCGAPHTRAAIVESKCIGRLISLLGEFQRASSSSEKVAYEKVAYAAGSALLQLIAGAVARATVSSSTDFELEDSVSPDKRDDVISDVVNGGAIGLFVTIARRSPPGKLRAMSVEALRVLSEDTNRSRRARLQLCEDGAPGALGRVMKDNVTGEAGTTLMRGMDDHLESMTEMGMEELHQALCAWANVLDRDEQVSTTLSLTPQSSSTQFEDADDVVVSGCLQFAEVGGFESLLRVSMLPFKQRTERDSERVQEMHLVVEACRCLASLSPLLLSTDAARKGHAGWSVLVLQVLAEVLLNDDENVDSELAAERKFDALRGIGSLTEYAPHKLAIVDKFLPSLVHAKTLRSDDLSYIAAAANQVCRSLGFSDDDLVKQIAGNDPKLMGDWFCMQRSLILQSMARAEIKAVLAALWDKPFRDIVAAGLYPTGLCRLSSGGSGDSSGQGPKEPKGFVEQATCKKGDSDGEQSTLDQVFETLAFDADCFQRRKTILEQYHDVYECKAISGVGDPFSSEIVRSCEANVSQASSLLSRHVYPLNSTTVEREWIHSHRITMEESDKNSFDHSTGIMSHHVQQLMDCCIPSRLIQHDVLPIFDVRPESLFDFRSVMMPQRRYFSFRREGQLVSQLCDSSTACIESDDDVFWTLAFTNSSFAGEFSETLVQALYRCPLVRGISFTRNDNWRSVWATESEDEGQDYAGLLVNLAGSLPPWISSITYDNTLDGTALTTLAAILETMGRLSASQYDVLAGEKDLSQSGQKQGSFQSFAVRNSPSIKFDAWETFFDLLGRSTKRSPSLKARPLSTLKVLDLSGNKLSDVACSLVLSRALDKESGCRLEQLDLSRNNIRSGVHVTKVLHKYIRRHRHNQSAGTYVVKSTWKAPLSSLNLGSNELHEGGLALEICALLKHNALSLKSLDLSSNGLCNSYEFTQVLVDSLVKNTVLRHLNLSGNTFAVECIDGLLDGLNRSDSDSGLAFLRLDDNRPPLKESQRRMLNDFVNSSRSTCLRRYLSDRERVKSGEIADLDSVDDGPMASHLERHGSEHSVSLFSAPDSLSPSDDGSSLRFMRRGSGGGNGENLITVLFSAPLVYQDKQRNHVPFAKLDFGMERDLLWQCLKEARRDIELKFDNATHHQLLAAKAKRCSCLHYSGHGHESHLPFEDGKGGPHWLDAELLQNLIRQDDGPPFKLVFVSACHSGLAGETFARAGVPHVVCCRQESEVKDTAALAFTRQFYLALAVGHTVKESFEQGCKAVRASPNLRNAEEQMKQFILLPPNGNHDEPIFENVKHLREWPRPSRSAQQALQGSKSRRKGLRQDSKSIYGGGARQSELSVRNMMQEDPSPTPPQFFIGREVDMYNVLNNVLTYRLVSVIGDKGVGKSSVVYGLCHYINERKSTILAIDRIFFVKGTQNRGSNRFVSVLRELLRNAYQDVPWVAQSQIDDMDRDSLIRAICKSLNQMKALLVIDRKEFFDGPDEQQDLVVFLSNLFQETRTQNVRVLLTGRQRLGIESIGGVPERPYTLGPLNFRDTVQLFGNLCPHLHTAADRQQVVRRLVTDEEQSRMLPSDHRATPRTRQLFHCIGDGIPSKIEKAAYSITSDDLDCLGLDDTESMFAAAR